MSVVVILTPILIGGAGGWPAITAAVAAAAALLGLTVKETNEEEVNVAEQVQNETRVEVELKETDALRENVATGQEIILAKGALEIRVRRDARGRCLVCARGTGYTEEQLKELAENFVGRMTQCFVYNRLMGELKNKGFQLVHEEPGTDDSIRIHVRRWEN